jgi:hypothetical protein
MGIPAKTITMGLLVAAFPASAASAPTTPDVTVLFQRAVKLVHNTSRPTFAHAVMYEADGLTRGGRGTIRASGIVSWRFVLRNSTGRYASVTVSYGPPPKRFGQVVGHTSPFLEDVVIRRAPKLTLGQAVARLRQAGHRKPFFNVTLRNPLGPKRSNPLYIFGFGSGRFIAVDTVTKRVRPIQ